MDKPFDLQRYIKEGWELFSANVANLIVATIIFVVVHLAAGMIPFGSLVISGPMLGGMFYIILDLRQGKPFNIMRMFDGFKKIVPLILVGVLTSVFTLAGFVLFVLPGFLVAGWYLFPYLFVIDEDRDFWDAMEASRNIGFNNHLMVFTTILVLGLFNLLGAMALGVGLVVSIPFTLCVIAKAYEDLNGIKSMSGNGAKRIDYIPPPPPPPIPTP